MTNLAVLGFLLVKHSENSARNNGNLMEAGFIRDKLNYLVSTHIVVNSENETSQLVLQVPNQETSIRIDRVNDQLVIHDGSNKSTALSNPSYKITSLNFNLLNKRQMLVELDLNGQHYAFHQHLWTNSE